MLDAPRSIRLHIAIFGKRNAGKSSLINAITNQELAVVSKVPGTTTDPVYKSMEISPIGPVTLIDTAGIDDEGELGELRVKKTMQVLAKTDLLVLTIASTDIVGEWEETITAEASKRCIPVVGVITKQDLKHDFENTKEWFKLHDIPFCGVNSLTREGIDELKTIIIKTSPKDFMPSTILGDLLEPEDAVLLVAPVDAGAPKSRLILPQVQVIRDALDAGACVTVVREHELEAALKNFVKPPKLVITDSQVFGTVSKLVPPEVPLTSFSILFARYKGNLREFLNGIKVLELLNPGDKVLIAEACTHYPSHEDIGRVKIPNWLEKKVGGKLDFKWVVGGDFPEDLPSYKLVVHCGACMINRAEVLDRLDRCKEAGVPVVNYGMLIAYINGILERVVKPVINSKEAGTK
jgi:[FeFe] hydrogenase H-cluster maturation GTPase HydF